MTFMRHRHHPDLTQGGLWEQLELTHHTGGAPDVSRCAVVSADQNLHRAVLTRLDVLGEVLVLRTGEKQVLFIPTSDI